MSEASALGESERPIHRNQRGLFLSAAECDGVMCQDSADLYAARLYPPGSEGGGGASGNGRLTDTATGR